MLTLRDYQEEAVAAPFEYFAEHTGNPLVVVPTGGGKSIIIGTFARRAIEQYPRTRILVLQHVKELIEQNYAELMELWPGAPAGIYSAGIGLRQIGAQILFGGIQSLRGKAAEIGHVDLILIDEAHMIPRSSDTTYQKLIRELQAINPYLKVIGYTATPFRLDSGLLHKGEGAMFDAIAYEVPIKLLFDRGYLCPLVTPGDLGLKAALPQIDTSKVHTQAGEFKASELDAAACNPETVQAVCDAIEEYGQDRKGWLVFGSGTQHVTDLHTELSRRGYPGGAIFGNTHKTERASLIEALKTRRLRYLASLGVLTTGFNVRHIDLIANARPTKSTVLNIQIWGRGTRCIGANIEDSIAAGKANCLALDFGGNIERHGPIDNPRVKEYEPGDKSEKDPKQPLRPCPCAPVCAEMNPIGLRYCAACGAPYPDPETLISKEASAASIMSNGKDKSSPNWVPVSRILYSKHIKAGSPPSLRVMYFSGLVKHEEWVCLEHTGFPRDKACRWWRKRGGHQVPGTVDDALALVHTLREPSHIAVMERAGGGMVDIVGAQFATAEAAA